MKYILIAISALLMSACASKTTKDNADASKTPEATATKEASAAAKKSDAKKAATANTTNPGDINCTYGDIQRTLRVIQNSERCSVEYTKDGAIQEIGTGSPNSTFCAEIAERVKNNLTAAGYKCSAE